MKKLSALLLLYSLFLSPVWAQENSTSQKAPPLEVLPAIDKAKAETEEARAQAQSVITAINKSIEDLGLELQKAEEESIRVMEEKVAPTPRITAPLELVVDAQLQEATKEKVKLLSKKLRILRDRLKAEEELLKERESTVALLKRKSKLGEEAAATPLEKAATAQKEAEVAEAYLQASEAELKEKEVNLEGLKVKLKEVQEKTEEKKAQRQKNLKVLEELPFSQEEGPQHFVRHRKLLAQIHLYNTHTKIAAAEEEINLAEKKLERAKIDFANAQLEVALLKDRASLLGKRLEAEEHKKKEEEAELAQKAEEEKKRKAEIEKAVVEREKEKALKEAEELAKKQLVAASPEQKRVLELESLVVTLKGEIVKKKDSLITEGTKRFEDDTEYKNSAKDVHTILGGENTPSEIKEEVTLLKKETTRWEEKLKAIESLAEAVKKERTLLAEQLEQARSELTAPPGEIPKLVQEVETFENKALAGKLKAYAQERIELLEEEDKLVAALDIRIGERRGIIQDGLKLIDDAIKELSGIKAANIWAKREWTASWLAMKEGSTKLLLPKKPSDLSTTIKKPTERKLRLLLSIVGILSLIAAVIFGSYYCIKWCRLSLKKLEEAEGEGG